MNAHFSNKPIVIGVNPHTGCKDGDDAGYRNVPPCPEDSVHPDPLVPVVGVDTRPVYRIGKIKCLCPYYDCGIGGPRTIVVRAPVLETLIKVNRRLEPYNRSLVVLDGFRPYGVQASLWRTIRDTIVAVEGRAGKALSFFDEVRIGMWADDVGSYCAVLMDEAYHVATKHVHEAHEEEIFRAAHALNITPDVVISLYLAFRANRGLDGLSLDPAAPTAHGNGGAVDLWMVDTQKHAYANMGVPFDFVAHPDAVLSPAVMDYFDLPHITVDDYAREIVRTPALRQYLQELGYHGNWETAFRDAQKNRRMLFHTMGAEGASFYLGECWHFNIGNGRDDNGNYCHALLTGKECAAWSNAVAHQLAWKILR